MTKGQHRNQLEHLTKLLNKQENQVLKHLCGKVKNTSTKKTKTNTGASAYMTPKYKAGGKLKPVPAGNKGLSKLPTNVRNKMGYMKKGGKIDIRYKGGGIVQYDQIKT